MRPPILIAFALLLAACGVKLDLERDILDGAENAVVWMTDLRDDIPLAHLSIPGAHDAASVSITSWPPIPGHRIWTSRASGTAGSVRLTSDRPWRTEPWESTTTSTAPM